MPPEEVVFEVLYLKELTLSGFDLGLESELANYQQVERAAKQGGFGSSGEDCRSQLLEGLKLLLGKLKSPHPDYGSGPKSN